MSKKLFLKNIDLIYENDGLWLAFREAIGRYMETRLWDERLFRRLQRDKVRLVKAIENKEVVLPPELYRKLARKLKNGVAPNKSHIKEKKSTEQSSVL